MHPPYKLHYWLRYSRCPNDPSLPFCVSGVHIWKTNQAISVACKRSWRAPERLAGEISLVFENPLFKCFQTFFTFIISSVSHSKCLIVLNGVVFKGGTRNRRQLSVNRPFRVTGVESRMYRFFIAIDMTSAFFGIAPLFWSIHDR